MAAALSPHDDPSTKGRLLDAAEALFAEHGFPGTSLRAITQLAGANLAAVNYHFSTKENLFAAVIARRLEPLNHQRLRMLETAEQRVAGKSLPVSEILTAIIRPSLTMIADPEAGGRHFATLLSRCHSEPNSGVHALVHAMVEPVFLRFLGALRASLPHLTEPTFRWRTHLLMGALFFLVAQGEYLEKHTAGICKLGNVREAESQFISFAVAGLTAPEP